MRCTAQSALISAAGNAPYLFGIGLEEDLVEARSEGALHPVFKAADVDRRAALCEQIADQTAQRLERAEVPQRIERFERIFEESTAVVDAREPRTFAHPITEQLGPERFDFGILREEPMAADIEAESPIFDSSRESSHAARISFKNFRSIAVAGKLVPGSKTGRPGSDDEDPMIVDIRQTALPAKALVTPHLESRVKKKLQNRG